MQTPDAPSLNRRRFLGTAALAGSAAALGFPAVLRGAADTKTLKVALVGCGGRGSGAAKQAVSSESNVKLVAMGDVFKDRLDTAHANLKSGLEDKVDVKDAHKFVGLDALDKILETDVDVVLLTTPPGFRAEHYEKVVKAGKHAFCEKPCAVDGPTYRRFMGASLESQAKGLGLLSGFCYRFSNGERELMKRIHDGEIGDVRHVYGAYLTQSPWVKERQEGWTDLEYQLRNWMYFTWLSGDHIVEQAIHDIDKMLWAFQDATPVKAWAVGGRQQRVEDKFGHVFDHFAVNYEFEGGRIGTIMCRQQEGTWNDNGERILGTKGNGRIIAFRNQALTDLKGETTWKYAGPKGDMYQNEHNEFFASIRAGKPLHMGEQLAHSSMVGILGRMAAYTGGEVTWEDAIASQETLRPAEKLEWNMKLATPAVPMPGRTKLV